MISPILLATLFLGPPSAPCPCDTFDWRCRQEHEVCKTEDAAKQKEVAAQTPEGPSVDYIRITERGRREKQAEANEYEKVYRTFHGLRKAGIISSIISHVTAQVFGGLAVGIWDGDPGYVWVVPVAGPAIMGGLHCAEGLPLCGPGAMVTMWQIGSLTTWIIGQKGLDKVRARTPRWYRGRYTLAPTPSGFRLDF